MNSKKATKTKFERPTVVPFRAGFDETAVLSNCLNFFRTRQIALDIAGARESELAHLRTCDECSARLRVFQRDLGTAPEEIVHHEIREAVPHVEEQHHEQDHEPQGIRYVVTMMATGLFISMKAKGEEDDHDDLDHWRHTHDLAYTLRFARTHDDHAEALFAACERALSCAAATHALRSWTIGSVHPFAECLEEGLSAVQASPPLLHAYSRLVSQVAIDGPPVVRHVVLWVLWNLCGYGRKARHAAFAALARIANSRHAPEVRTAAAFICHLHGGGKSPVVSPEVPMLQPRIDRAQAWIVRMLRQHHSHLALIARFERMLSGAFDHRSARAQVINLIVTRAALEGALREAAARGVSSDVVQHCLSRLFFRHHDHRARPLLIDCELAAAAAEAFPNVYAHTLTEAVRPDGTHGLPLRHERHAVIVSAVKAYNRRVLAGAPPVRFHKDDHGWRFDGSATEGLHSFFRALAAMASEHPAYAFHLEWANARFESVMKKQGGKAHRAGRRHTRRARGRRHGAGTIRA